MISYLEDAKGALAGCEGSLGARLRDAFAASVRLLPFGDVDVGVRVGTDVIPEKGHLGHAPGTGVIPSVIDPDYPMLRANPDSAL